MPATDINKAKVTRRSMLRAGLSWAAVSSLPRMVRGYSANRDGHRTLVLLHLSGGNDGLNTIIPYADPRYYKLRPDLSRVVHDALPISEKVAFHSSLRAMLPLFEEGGIAIVQGVGYPDPDYSHVGSCRIWATGEPSGDSYHGWRDAVLDGLPGRAGTKAAVVGGKPPAPIGTKHAAYNFRSGEEEGDRPSFINPLPYCPGSIGQTLTHVARLVESACPPHMIIATVGGFDTHTDQLQRHGQVLRELGDGLVAFQRHIEACGAAERVILMAWSEFGRRPAENANGGTDHGSAGTVFLLGRQIRGGLYGRMPSLKDTDFGNLIPTTDFRALYAMIAERWFNCQATTALTEPGQPFVFL